MDQNYRDARAAGAVMSSVSGIGSIPVPLEIYVVNRAVLAAVSGLVYCASLCASSMNPEAITIL